MKRVSQKKRRALAGASSSRYNTGMAKTELVCNKKVRHDYEILDRFEAGIELRGFEVKSLRDKQCSLDGSRVIVRGGEAYLVGATIPPYQPENTPKDYDPAQNRRLLLKKKEILELAEREDKKGLTIVPTAVYNKDGKIKLEVAVVRGKKKYDKRETLKKREDKRVIEREIKKSIRL